MKVRFDRNAAQAPLALAAMIASPRHSPITQNLRLIAEDGALRVVATNIEQSVCTIVPGAEVMAGGDALVDAALLKSLVDQSPSAPLLLQSTKTGIDVQSLGDSFSLPTADPADFPKINVDMDAPGVAVDAPALSAALRAAATAVALEHGRYALNGVHIAMTAKTVEVVGTDGRRLAYTALPAAATKRGKFADDTRLVPQRAIRAIQAITASGAEKVTIAAHGAAGVLFATQHAALLTQVVAGNYPAYKDVVPPPAHQIAADKAALSQALSRAKLLTSAEFQAVRIEIDGPQAILKSSSPARGKGIVHLPIEHPKGGPDEPLPAYAADPQYMETAVSCIGAEKVMIELTDGGSFILHGGDRSAAYYLVMGIDP